MGALSGMTSAIFVSLMNGGQILNKRICSLKGLFCFVRKGFIRWGSKQEVTKVFTLCKIGSVYLPCSHVNKTYFRAFSDIEKPFFFSDLVALTTKLETEKGFSKSEKPRITRVPG